MQSKATAAAPALANTILIRGREVPVINSNLEQAKLRFYPENPRVYSVLHGSGEAPTQEDIQERLLQMEHVKLLIQDIRLNEGLIEPLIVRDGTLEVLEGNSRLAAYRFLAKSNPVKWGYVKCSILPNNIDGLLVFALLGQLHIKGKKDWAPYEQAGFLYRRYKQHNADIKALALEINISSQKIKHLIETYQFMLDNSEVDVSRWSYYDEYLKSSKIKKARKCFPVLDGVVVKKIRSQEIERAVDLRAELPVICSAPGVALEKFVSGEWSFEKAFQHAHRCGGDNIPLRKLTAFRKWLTRKSTSDGLMEFDGQMRSKLRFELGKIANRSSALTKRLSK
jgi:hypothetical protein